MGSKGGDPKQRVVDYYASVHYGICHAADALLEIWYGEKRAWSGNVTSNSTVSISKRNMFGGNKVEGGLEGSFDVLLGGASQTLPGGAVSALQRNGVPGGASGMPGYRGIMSIFMRGSSGAFVGSNTAVIKNFWFKIRRSPKQCPFNTVITVAGMQLANPAGIIYETMVNREWGMGVPGSLLNTASFTSAAATLNSEGFGLAMLWHRQESAEDFISTVLAHIDASLAFDPFTGQFRLKLIRGDYDVEDVPVVDPSNAQLESFDRSGWGETINEINVKWTNPVTEKEEVVTVHDTANISIQGGGSVSETRDFYGIRTANLALRVATRELLTASSAMARAQVAVNRDAWRVLPGDPVLLRWDPYGIDQLPMRVLNVDYGAPGSSRIRISLIEDIFGMPETSYVTSPGSAWVNPSREPEPLTHAAVFSLPFYLAVQRTGEIDVESAPTDVDVAVMVGAHDLPGHFNFDVVQSQPNSQGVLEWVVQTTADMAARGLLPAALPRESSSTFVPAGLTGGGSLLSGVVGWIGPFDSTGELVHVTGYDIETGQVTVNRGVLDTVPAAWDAETPIWFLPGAALGIVPEEQAVNQGVSLRGLPRTALDVLPLSAASSVGAVMSGRLHRPYRPGRFRVDGQVWPAPDFMPEFPLLVQWNRRNRLTETAIISAWESGAVTPEDGTTYEVVLFGEMLDGTRTEFHREDLGNASNYTIDLDVTPPPVGHPYLVVQVWAMRDGLRSWQPAWHRVGILTAPSGLSAEYIEPEE